MINRGTIIADQDDAIQITPGATANGGVDAAHFTNEGTMRATGAGGFIFSGAAGISAEMILAHLSNPTAEQTALLEAFVELHLPRRARSR